MVSLNPKSAIDLSGSTDFVISIEKTRQKAGISFIFFCLGESFF